MEMEGEGSQTRVGGMNRTSFLLHFFNYRSNMFAVLFFFLLRISNAIDRKMLTQSLATNKKISHPFDERNGDSTGREFP